MAYADNVFVGRPRVFGYFDLNKSHATLEDFRAALAKDGSLASQTGWQAEEPPVLNAEKHDFRPRAGSAVIDRGVKYFVPWSLSAVVGEWQFYKLPADPTRILGENWYATEEYTRRDMYYRIPRNDLKAHNVTAADYVKGTLEDWTEGALSLNGRDQFCAITDAECARGTRSRSRNLDMDMNDFLIEAIFRTKPSHTGGALVSKFDSAGYALEIDNTGRVRMCIGEYSRTSLTPVNDGKWHHLIAEVDRAAPEGIRIYIDGKPAGGKLSGPKPAPSASLTNTADFLVGKSFAGAIDYLRVARGTLADARTSIEELYKWEFDGPFLTDFRGKSPTGARRDAGAYEYAPKSAVEWAARPAMPAVSPAETGRNRGFEHVRCSTTSLLPTGGSPRGSRPERCNGSPGRSPRRESPRKATSNGLPCHSSFKPAVRSATSTMKAATMTIQAAGLNPGNTTPGTRRQPARRHNAPAFRPTSSSVASSTAARWWPKNRASRAIPSA